MKYTTTEKYYTNCPNCHANLGTDDKECPYCGTGLVYERTFTQEDTVSIDMSKVDIESKADASYGAAGYSVGIAFMFFWCFMAFGMAIAVARIFGPIGFFPAAMGAFGVFVLIKMILEKKQFQSVSASAPRYKAIVLDHQVYTEVHRSRGHSHTVTLAKIKVLANINGTKKVILLKVGSPENAAKYPEGSEVTLAGSGEYFVIL